MARSAEVANAAARVPPELAFPVVVLEGCAHPVGEDGVMPCSGRSLTSYSPHPPQRREEADARRAGIPLCDHAACQAAARRETLCPRCKSVVKHWQDSCRYCRYELSPP